MIERTDGIIIACFFIMFILIVSGVSRFSRAKELRVGGHRFADPESERLWNLIVEGKVSMVPIGDLERNARALRTAKLHRYYTSRGVLRS